MLEMDWVIQNKMSQISELVCNEKKFNLQFLKKFKKNF